MPKQSQPEASQEEPERPVVIETGREYDFVGDLSKVPAKISILEQLKKSQPHREMLNRFLGEAEIPENITPEGLEQVI